MAALRKRESPFDFLRRNNWLLLYKFAWVAIVALFVTAIIWLFLPRIHKLRELQKEEVATREDIRAAEAQINDLKVKQVRLESDPEFLEEMARTELGWAKTGETVFKVIAQEPDGEDASR
jgi:cell division protein FtsB